jgi:nicotinamidase-related amidase
MTAHTPATDNTISAATSVLVLVDYQQRLMPAIHDGATAAKNAGVLAQAARLLGVATIVTEQNPDGLGPTVDAVKTATEGARTLAKTHFDACADGLLDEPEIAGQAFTQVVVAGCEAHVCMLQTAMSLLRAGKRVWVVDTASGSRRAGDHAAAMNRLAQAGATVVTHEMVLFEWLADCRHPRFREVLKLIKDT